MAILIKFTLKSIRERKFRTFLIVFSIALTTALTFASLALKDSITDTFTEMIKKYLGTANIIISADENSPSSNIRIRDLGENERLIEYQIGAIDTTASYKTNAKGQPQKLSIRGYELEDLNTLGVVKTTSVLSDTFEGKVIYISEQLAKTNGWALGSTIDLTLNGGKHKVLIAGLGTAEGALAHEAALDYAVMPAKTLQQLFDLNDKYFFLMVKTAEGVSVADAMSALKEVYPRYKVEEPIPWDVISQQLNSIIIPFLFMLTLVMATSVFIIYTAFKVIIAEKMPILGTFRSMGATKKTTDFILLTESLIYGLVGAIIGLWIGRMILSAMGNMMAQGMLEQSGAAKTEADSIYYLIAAAFAIILSLVSSIIPIIQVSKIPVRDIVLGTSPSSQGTRRHHGLIGLSMLFVSIALPLILKGNSNLVISGLTTIMLCVSLVILTPFFTNILVDLLEPFIAKFFGNLGLLAIKNIRGNQSIVNNIALLTLGLAGLLLINTISASVTEEVLNVYSKAHYDVTFSTELNNRDVEQTLLGLPGVEDVYGVYQGSQIEVLGHDKKISLVDGVKDMNYFNYWDIDIVSDRKLVEATLGNTRALVVSTVLRDRYQLKLGDYLDLKFSDQITRKYQVVGFISTLMQNGDYALASAKFLKEDLKLAGYGNILLKTTDPDAVKATIEQRFKHQWFYVSTMKENIASNEASNAVVMVLLQGFSIIAMTIGAFGILNNFVVSLLGRQRVIAVMKSVGMSRRQTRHMLGIEAFLSGLMGGAFAVLGGLILIQQVGILLHMIDLPVTLHYYPHIFILGFLAGGFISLVANWLPAQKTSKMNIVKAIKFE